MASPDLHSTVLAVILQFQTSPLISNRCRRLTTDSPNLLAIIKQESKA